MKLHNKLQLVFLFLSGFLPGVYAQKPSNEFSVLDQINMNYVWTANAGKNSISASFLRIKSDMVVLKKEDGDLIEVPIDKLDTPSRNLAKYLVRYRPLLRSIDKNLWRKVEDTVRVIQKEDEDVEERIAELLKNLRDLAESPEEWKKFDIRPQDDVEKEIVKKILAKKALDIANFSLEMDEIEKELKRLIDEFLENKFKVYTYCLGYLFNRYKLEKNFAGFERAEKKLTKEFFDPFVIELEAEKEYFKLSRIHQFMSSFKGRYDQKMGIDHAGSSLRFKKKAKIKDYLDGVAPVSESDRNEFLGRHFCFESDDWKKGIEYFANSPNENLKQVAQLEKSTVKTTEELLEMSKLYFDIAKESRVNRLFRTRGLAILGYLVNHSELKKEHRKQVIDRLLQNPLTNRVGIKFRYVPPGGMSFVGERESRSGREFDKIEYQPNYMTKGFWLQEDPMTEKQYNDFKLPDQLESSKLLQISMEDLQKFLSGLNANTGFEKGLAAGLNYNIPKESEWNYAMRAGTSTIFFSGNEVESAKEYSLMVDVDSTSEQKGETNISSLKPNPWGFRGMYHWNSTGEWCRDRSVAHLKNLFTTRGSFEDKKSERVGQTPGSTRLAIYVSPDEFGRRPTTTISAEKTLPSDPGAIKQLAQSQNVSSYGKLQKSAKDCLEVESGGIYRNSIGMLFRKIPKGTFSRTNRAFSDENKQINIPQPYLIGMHEVTQAQYQKIMGENPSKYRGDSNPVESVCWFDAIEFCRKLSESVEEKKLGYFYRLPTGDEWELACRGGEKTKYFFGNDAKQLGRFAWYGWSIPSPPKGNSWIKDKTRTSHKPVGLKLPNEFGLFDVLGNVSEWCQDKISDSTRRRRYGGSHFELDAEGFEKSFGLEFEIPFAETDKDEMTGFRIVLEPLQSENQEMDVATLKRLGKYLAEKKLVAGTEPAKMKTPAVVQSKFDPAKELNGVWLMTGVSFDEGKTTSTDKRGKPVFSIGNGQITSLASRDPPVKITRIKGSNISPNSFHVVLENGRVWTFTRHRDFYLVIVQTGEKELVRYTIKKQ